jgi:hypothetical protein
LTEDKIDEMGKWANLLRGEILRGEIPSQVWPMQSLVDLGTSNHHPPVETPRIDLREYN